MSLRAAAAKLSQRQAQLTQLGGINQQQKRFAGDLPVKSNKYIENW